MVSIFAQLPIMAEDAAAFPRPRAHPSEADKASPKREGTDQIPVEIALPQREADLMRHYTLSDEDLQNIRARRRPRNKLGFALQLCVLRHPVFERAGIPKRLHPPVGGKVNLDLIDRNWADILRVTSSVPDRHCQRARRARDDGDKDSEEDRSNET